MSDLGQPIVSNHETSKECEFPNNPYYVLFTTTVSFYLPFIIMIYVYIKVYLAAKKQASALRSGYKRQHLIKSKKSCIPKFRLRQTLIEKGSKIKKRVKISNKNVHNKSNVLLQNPRVSIELITLRIHCGSYQHPTLESINQNHEHDNTFVNKILKQNIHRKNLWRQISQDQKATKFIGIVMGAFIGCWLPLFVYLLLNGVFGLRLKDDQNHQLLFNILTWLGYTNSALDVLVYAFTSKELKTLFLNTMIEIKSIKSFKTIHQKTILIILVRSGLSPYVGQLDVTLGNQARDGDLLKRADTQITPTVQINLKTDSKMSFFTLVMIDPDAPRRGNEVAGPWLHWIKASFKGNNVNSGTTLADYQGPAPPDGTGPHQYIILLYKSANGQVASGSGTIGVSDSSKRKQFQLQKFEKNNNFKLVAATSFIVRAKETNKDGNL
ncbi:unnamed protein product [Rotaria sordida]|uniref:G-protein coupled receptors family 1 profile domain-containing protein n=1 Tax=Rotaria sordida TaxID=392033 RepID=A0A814XHU1_9BILA|nr:unnamed protein product [Rotaria sordida]